MPARFFVDGIYRRGDLVTLAADDARKLRVVLRARSGDAVVIRDSSGTAFAATLAVGALGVRAVLGEPIEQLSEATIELTLAQAIPKAQKMDYVVEKLTELGVTRILPFTSERTIAPAAGGAKLERWRRLARSAAQQCGRAAIPRIDEPVRWPSIVAGFGEFDRVIVPWEGGEQRSLRDRLPELVRGARRLLVAIGPEGGFAAAEITSAQAAGAAIVSLGPRIFRTETAGFAACAAILYETGAI